MPKKVLPRIAAVTPGQAPMTLRVRRDKGDESVIDVSGMIESCVPAISQAGRPR